MSIHEGGWAEGTPCWVDVTVDDIDKAVAFYSELFGWECEAGPPETGAYTTCSIDGQVAAGIGVKMEAMASAPSFWTTYLAADSADAVAAKITGAGGSVMAEPFDVMEFGRMAIGLDANQAAFGLWQGNQMGGAGVVNQPGALTWNENMSRDIEAAKAFYVAVFGFGVDDMSSADMRYAGLTIDGQAVAGVGELPPEAPAEMPAMWTTYFSTADTDATVAKATGLGATLVSPPADTPFGRMASLQGPEGEFFSVIDSNDTTQPS